MKNLSPQLIEQLPEECREVKFALISDGKWYGVCPKKKVGYTLLVEETSTGEQKATELVATALDTTGEFGMGIFRGVFKKAVPPEQRIRKLI